MSKVNIAHSDNHIQKVSVSTDVNKENVDILTFLLLLGLTYK